MILPLLFFVFTGPSVHAADRPATEAVGFYSSGSLSNSADLLAGDTTRIHKLLQQRHRSFGTAEMVSTIQGLATYVTNVLPGPTERLQIGDIAQARGGQLEEHASHQNGLDADIVYLTRNHVEQGPSEDYWTEWFVQNGKITANFDVERNWAVFKFLAKQPLVQRIFVDSVIKNAICAYAKKIGEYATETHTLSTLSREDTVHQTHFHLRLKCPAGHARCTPQAPPDPAAGC